MSKAAETSQSKGAKSLKTDARAAYSANQVKTWSSEFGPACVGRIVSIGSDRRPQVDFAGNPNGPVPSLCLRGLELDAKTLAGDSPVVLIFEHGDSTRPIIVGAVDATLPPQTGSLGNMDNTHSVLRAEEEITLVCGKSSLSLARNGRITLRGVEIVSRASGSNKIRGASVSIN